MKKTLDERKKYHELPETFGTCGTYPNFLADPTFHGALISNLLLRFKFWFQRNLHIVRANCRSQGAIFSALSMFGLAACTRLQLVMITGKVI